MNITVYSGFSKRQNSTKQPTTGTDVTIVLKAPVNILNPVFEVAATHANANYVHVSEWGRYYFVQDVTYITNDVIELHCVVDVLASYKTQVGSTTALIEYTSASTNILIPDPRNKPSCSIIESHTNLLDLSSAGFSGGGMFILAVAGGTGGVTYYEMDGLKLQAVLNEIYDVNFVQALENQFYDVTNCIVSCILVPGLPEPETGTDTIYVGGQALTNSATKISRYKTVAEASYSITFPFGDGIWAEGSENYVDYEYSVGSLYLPFVGSVPLDISIVAHSRQIRIGAEIDWYTGDIVYKIANATDDFIASYSGHFAANVPIVAQTYNPMGVASGILATAMGAASMAGGATGQGLAGVAGGVAYTISSLAFHTQVNGSLSSAVSSRLGLKAIATVITRTPSEPDLRQFQATSGMPFFQVASISSVSGYVKCWNASCSCPGTEQEKSKINNYLNNGFYYE